MRVLVTGSEGSLMQFVVRELTRRGHQVRGVDNFFRYGVLERSRDYEFMQTDLCDSAVARQATQDMEVIVQGAARIFGVAGFHKYPADILAHDVTLHQNLLWAALEGGIRRVVYISSSMVYERCRTVPSREEEVDDMQIPRTDYGLSKLVGERLTRAFHTQYGLAYTIWRPFNIITPLEKGETEPGISHVFADFIRRIVVEQENPMRIFGDGEQIRCFTWIEDVARPIAEHLVSADTANEIFNLGNPEPVSMRELAQRISRTAASKGLIASRAELQFAHLPAFEDDVRVRVPSIEKASRRLGWRPTVNLDQALDRCLEQLAREFAPRP